MGTLDGRVVIITGAGEGIGRQHALVFAREGAMVVVNDTGGDPHGNGTDPRVADRVVRQIRAEGGQAVANTSDVANWDTGRELVEQALDEFGDLHVVVNNAGILRHSQIADMAEEDFDRVIGVHVKGHFATIRHASHYWRLQHAAGRTVRASIVNTASPEGLLGGRNMPESTDLEFGIEMAQSNYAAAKSAILGLTLNCAIELYRYGIRTNALCPLARTRLAELYPPALSGMDEVTLDWPGEEPAFMHPRWNSFVAGWLASEDCPANGTVWNPALGTLWTTWSQAGSIPMPQDRWPTIEEIDHLVRDHVGFGALTVLGRPHAPLSDADGILRTSKG